MSFISKTCLFSCVCLLCLGIHMLPPNRLFAENLSSTFSKVYAQSMQGDVNAMYDLGLMYMEGKGTGKDLVKAYAFIHLTATLGNRAVRELLAEIEASMTTEQKGQAEKCIEKLWNELPKK